MSTWVLILMLSIPGGVAVEQVEGFQTRAACAREGAAVMAAWKGSASFSALRGGAFHCAELRWEEGQ